MGTRVCILEDVEEEVWQVQSGPEDEGEHLVLEAGISQDLFVPYSSQHT